MVLIAAPVLAWSRYRIAATSIAPAVLANLRVHLQAHVLAKGAQAVGGRLPVQPRPAAAGLLRDGRIRQGDLRRRGSTTSTCTSRPRACPRPRSSCPTPATCSPRWPCRAAPPLFRWQEPDGTRDNALEQWRAQGGACLTPLLPGCAVDLVLPESYFAASRAADKDSRPYSVRASVAFLGTTLETPAANLRAVIAPFWERNLEEYRIGFTVRGQDAVVHGVVWPLLGAEDETTDCAAQIETVLRESGRQRHRVPRAPVPDGVLRRLRRPALPLARGRGRPRRDARGTGPCRCRAISTDPAPEAPTMSPRSSRISKPDAEWRRQLTDLQYHVAREKGTERAFTGEYWDVWDQGAYNCVCCGAPLFRSEHKFDAGCGWPSFWTAAEPDNVESAVDRSHFMVRTEVLCHQCGAHLGHVFEDGPQPTGLRYCINSASIKLEKDGD